MATARRKRVMQCVAASALLLSTVSAFAYDWLQFGGNAQRSGNNTAETAITRANVGALTLKYRVGIPATRCFSRT